MSKTIAQQLAPKSPAAAPVATPAATPESDALAATARMLREIEELKAANAALKASQARTGRISMKVSEKGALSVYGLGRFPVTLYREQWTRLMGESTAILAFIEAHPELKSKE